jgi:glucan phosphoethanolaminetransferase (alkaline phosphatase superfamily)
MNEKPIYPYRLDSNARYREVVKFVMTYALASITVPILFARNLLVLSANVSLVSIFDWKVYCSWLFCVLSILSGLVFYYASAVWIRLAWGKPSALFGIEMNDKRTESVLDWTFWLSISFWGIGFVLIILFFLFFVT